MTTLRSHITAGYKDKLILLKSYDEITAGFVELDLPVLTIPELFLTNKLGPRTWASPPGLGPPSPPQSLFIPTSYSSALRRKVSMIDVDNGGSSDEDISDRRVSMGSKHVNPGIVSSD